MYSPPKNAIIINALIEKASITLDRDVFLSVWLHLDYGSLHQGFGGYVLGGLPDCKAGQHHEQKNIAAEFIVSCLQAGDVDTFSKLQGRTIRVQMSEEGLGGKPLAIGHIIKDDRWFCPEIRLKELCS